MYLFIDNALDLLAIVCSERKAKIGLFCAAGSTVDNFLGLNQNLRFSNTKAFTI